MNKMIPLMQREWLQHRFGWLLMAVLPLSIGLLLTGVGSVQMANNGATAHASDVLPAMLAAISIAATTTLVFAIAWIASLIIVTGLARRDHADRSIEFWLSVPAGHAESLASPMLVHLLVVPAVALLVGLVSGYAISAVLVSRVVGIGGWLALALGRHRAGHAGRAVAPAGRPAAGHAVAAATVDGHGADDGVVPQVGLGHPGGGRGLRWPAAGPRVWPAAAVAAINDLFVHAIRALVYGGADNFAVNNPDEAVQALRAVPAWALDDAGRALRALLSPLLAGGLCSRQPVFALLVQWRQRGAGAAS